MPPFKQEVIGTPLHVGGSLTCDEFTAPPGSISNPAIANGDPIDWDKTIARHKSEILWPETHDWTLGVQQTRFFFRVDQISQIIDLQIVFAEAMTNYQVTFDFQRSTGAGAWASMFDPTPPVFLSTDLPLVIQTFNMNTAIRLLDVPIVDGDLFRILTTTADFGGGTPWKNVQATLNFSEQNS